MRMGSVKQDRYDPTNYAGLINRIRDGVALTDGQKRKMAECGLTIEDFRNQPTTEEKVALLNKIRGAS